MDKNTETNLIWAIAIIGILANIFDLITTFIALRYYGLIEINPYLAPLISSYPLFGYTVKLIVGTWLFLPLRYCPFNIKIPFNLVKDKHIKIIIITLWIFIATILISLGINNILFISHSS